MQQYLELLKTIQEKGTYKPAAREGIPGTQSLFGYQFRHNLADGFPILTTKEVFWKGIVIELLWFLRGDTNIKYLVDNGVNIWSEDAYNYYCKQFDDFNKSFNKKLSFEEFIELLKSNTSSKFYFESVDTDYSLGDCGYQYGKVWRKWEKTYNDEQPPNYENNIEIIDQIKNVINSLKNNPESRRHIVTAIDPAHDQDLALYWCHAMFQFNCRSLTLEERIEYLIINQKGTSPIANRENKDSWQIHFKHYNTPKYYLDCQLYQRSADVVLGVPFNIASYALLTEIIAKMCNMIPGEFIHTFGDVHIYDNHKEAVEEQLKRTPTELPKLRLSDIDVPLDEFDMMIQSVSIEDFQLENYNPQSKIKAKLSTGLK